MSPLDFAGVRMIGCNTGSCAVLLQFQTVNVAPPIGSPFGSVVECFSTRASPPTVKHAGPALRLLDGEADGLAVVFATLHTRSPICALAGIVAVKLKLKSTLFGTMVNDPESITAYVLRSDP